MIDRQTVYYYIGLAVLCIMVVATVVLYVKPRIEEKPPPISQPPSSAQSGRLQKRDITEGTRAIMQTKYEEKETPETGIAKRNPFLWAGEIGPKKSTKQTSVPQLGMIIMGPKQRIAFLDQKPVYEGQKHGGYRVEKIFSNGVTLSNAYGRFQLITPKDSFGPAQVKRLERSRP